MTKPQHWLVAGLLTLLSLFATAEPAFIGSQACSECHADQVEAWTGSHHQLAMQPANTDTVLGDFEDQRFSHNGIESRFFRDGEKYMVETDGADGELATFEVSYVFGVDPLQQYLIGFPDGRYQALTIAWDTRDAAQGGQRWFHLYPDETIPAGDPLHWLAPVHNWNLSCAECHSTNLKKGYDWQQDSYATTWSEINVACEACHGPAAEHVDLAQAASVDDSVSYPDDHALTFKLQGRNLWQPQSSGNAVLLSPATGASQVEACGRCHARRGQLTDNYAHGRSLSDTHRVATLTPDLYFADGQILDEVYVYGSFRQSAMYAAGVVCSDCHEPHSLKLRAEGDALCASCHAPASYAVPEHHHHADADTTPQCVDCHMPDRNYMQVDPRRDHSFRIPRPDRSARIGTPNACGQCHDDKPADWAMKAVADWYESPKPGHQAFAETLHAARIGAPRARTRLLQLITDANAPAIARATALEMLSAYLSPDALSAIRAAVADPDPQVRRAAVDAIAAVDIRARLNLLLPLLGDEVLGVRVAAAGALADARAEQLESEQWSALEKATAEYVATELFNADRAEHWLNLAAFYASRGAYDDAEKAFAEARRRAPALAAIYVNQADFYRMLGREGDSEQTLLSGLEAAPNDAALQHALGLLRVRQQQSDAALSALGKAVDLAPESARFAYVYGVALESYGQADEAIKVWRAALFHQPNDREILYALIGAQMKQGEVKQALADAQYLLQLQPDDNELRDFVRQLAPQVQ